MRNPRCIIRVALNVILIICSLRSFSQPIDSLINKDSIRSIVEFLASDSMKGRFTGSPESITAAVFIATEFKRAGIQPSVANGGYLLNFPTRLRVDGFNVIGHLQGTETPAEMIIFCAHYDHVGTISTNPFITDGSNDFRQRNDTIFNGANDNASGTSALISLARYFGALKNNKRTILFIAFSGEELGLVGSKALVASLVDPTSIKCVINLEMLGRGGAPFITGSEYGNCRSILNKELETVDKKRFGKRYFKADGYPDSKLFMRSDNYPFAKIGIPAYTIMTTSDQDSYYHTVDDEASTLDYGKIARIVQAVALATDPLINKGVSPQRIKIDNYRRGSDTAN